MKFDYKHITTISLLTVAMLIAAPDTLARGRNTVLCHSPAVRSSSAPIEAYLAESVDIQPEFPGGEVALMRYINAERHYPQAAYNNGIQGRVLCSFIVSPDGSITNVEVIRGVDESLNREAVRVIQKMPRWSAGKIGQNRVPVFCILPIPFRL